MLSLLGFIAAAPDLGIQLPERTDPSMIGVLAVASLLPGFFLVIFFLMLLSGLMSTLDSGLNAFSSLYVIDAKKYTDSKNLSNARLGMLIILFAGLAVATLTAHVPDFGLKQLWWIFNAVGATLVVPTLLTLYWNKLTAKGAFYGIFIALLVGLPIFVYANFVDDTMMIVASAFFILAINLFSCWIFRKR